MLHLKQKLEFANQQYDQNLNKSAKKLERVVPELYDKIQKIEDRL